MYRFSFWLLSLLLLLLFKGQCRYTLVTDDCPSSRDSSAGSDHNGVTGKSTFSVQVFNDPRRSKHYSWTRGLLIRIDKHRVSCGIKVNISNRESVHKDDVCSCERHVAIHFEFIVLIFFRLKIRLGQMMKVKILGKRIKLPYVVLGDATIFTEGASIVVRLLKKGIKVS